MSEINLAELVGKANFAHSEIDPTTLSSVVITDKHFYYLWKGSEEVDILTFEDNNIETAKLFRRKLLDFKEKPLNLKEDTPSYTGNQVVKILEQYAREFQRAAEESSSSC